MQREETFRIREYFVVLKLRKWSIIAITLLAVLAAIFFTREQTPVYTSTISVVATDPLAQIYSGTSRGPNMTVEESLVKSLPVTQCTQQILKNPSLNVLGADLSKICAPETLANVAPNPDLAENVAVDLPVGTTGAPTAEALFTISYPDPSPATAQKTAQAFALAYKDYKVSQANASLTQLTDPIQTSLDEVNKNLSKVKKEIDDLVGQISTATQTDAARLSAQLRTKQDEEQQLNAQAATLTSQLAEFSPLRINPPDIPAPAVLPVKPSSPKLVINVGLALIVGLAFGIGLAFLREKLDDRLRGRGDVEERLGTSVLAVIPHVSGWRRRHGARLASVDHPRGPAAEAYRTLRTSVMFAAAQRGVKVIMVTSPGAGEGKSTTAANLSVGLAEAGKRVILLSADLRNPRVHEFFGLNNDVGVANALSGEVKPWEALLSPEMLDTLRVMASGPVPSRPAELLQSDRMGELLAQLRDVADYVIIDTAPVLIVADALAIAPLVDGVLVVADAQSTNRGAVTHAREQLDQLQAPIIGAVLNNFDPSKARSYSYYYYGYYPYRYGYGYRQGDAYRTPPSEPNGETGSRERISAQMPGGPTPLEPPEANAP